MPEELGMDNVLYGHVCGVHEPSGYTVSSMMLYYALCMILYFHLLVQHVVPVFEAHEW